MVTVSRAQVRQEIGPGATVLTRENRPRHAGLKCKAVDIERMSIFIFFEDIYIHTLQKKSCMDKYTPAHAAFRLECAYVRLKTKISRVCELRFVVLADRPPVDICNAISL